MALHNVRDKDNYAHIRRVCGHMSKQSILWHRSHSKNAQFSDTDVAKVRPICKACAYGELRLTAMDQHQVHRLMPTIPGQCLSIDAFTCKHVSIRGYKYSDLMRDNASQMIYCNFTRIGQQTRLFFPSLTPGSLIQVGTFMIHPGRTS